MNEPAPLPSEPSRAGCLVAAVLILVPAVISFLRWGEMPAAELPIALFWGALLATPFGYLALEGPKSSLPWLVASGLTACFWGALIISAIFSARDKTGVNFGMGLIMLASPIVVTYAARRAVQFTKRT